MLLIPFWNDYVFLLYRLSGTQWSISRVIEIWWLRWLHCRFFLTTIYHHILCTKLWKLYIHCLIEFLSVTIFFLKNMIKKLHYSISHAAHVWQLALWYILIQLLRAFVLWNKSLVIWFTIHRRYNDLTRLIDRYMINWAMIA